jgi:hypothetical protein
MTSIASDLAAMIRRYATAVERAHAGPLPEELQLRRQDADEIRMVADYVELIEDHELERSIGIEFHFSIEDRELGSHIEVDVGGWMGTDRPVGFRDPALTVLDVITAGELMRDDAQAQS